MSHADKVAVVTGSNKGIGYGIVKELLNRGVGVVYLTARDVNRGQEAVNKLKKEGYKPHFHQLEVTDKDSVKALAEYLKKKHGGIDILINNAAVISENFTKTNYEDALRVINTNYKSMFIIKEYIYPVLKDNARVVNISSDCGHPCNIRNKQWLDRLTKKDLKVEDVEAFVDWFLDSMKNGTLNEEDFQSTALVAYKISKIALSALTRVHQNEIGRNISMHSIHPGFVPTDMTMSHGMQTVEQSSEAVVYVALDVDQSLKGRYFWFDKTEKDWDDYTLPLYPDREEQKAYMKTINWKL